MKDSLLKAVGRGDVALVDRMLKNGNDPNDKINIDGENEMNGLIVAATLGYIDIAKLLIVRRAKLLLLLLHCCCCSC